MVWSHIFEVKLYQTAESICQNEAFLLPLPISLLSPSFLTHSISPTVHCRGLGDSAELTQCTNLAEKQPLGLVFCWTSELVQLTVGSSKHQRQQKASDRSGSWIALFTIHESLTQFCMPLNLLEKLRAALSPCSFSLHSALCSWSPPSIAIYLLGYGGYFWLSLRITPSHSSDLFCWLSWPCPTTTMWKPGWRARFSFPQICNHHIVAGITAVLRTKLSNHLTHQQSTL